MTFKPAALALRMLVGSINDCRTWNGGVMTTRPVNCSLSSQNWIESVIGSAVKVDAITIVFAVLIKL